MACRPPPPSMAAPRSVLGAERRIGEHAPALGQTARPAATAASRAASRRRRSVARIEGDAVEAVGERVADLRFGGGRADCPTPRRGGRRAARAGERRRPGASPRRCHAASSAYSTPDEPTAKRRRGRRQPPELPAGFRLGRGIGHVEQQQAAGVASSRSTAAAGRGRPGPRGRAASMRRVRLAARWRRRSASAHGRHGVAAHHRVAVDPVGLAPVGGEQRAEGRVALELRRPDHERHHVLSEDSRRRSRPPGRCCRPSGWNRRSSRPCSGTAPPRARAALRSAGARCASIQAGVSLRLVPAMPTAPGLGKRASCADVGASVNSTVGTPREASASMASVEPVRSSP